MSISISSIDKWLWVNNPVNITVTDSGTSLEFVKAQIWDGTTKLAEGYYTSIDNKVIRFDFSGYCKSVFDLLPEYVNRNPANVCSCETAKKLNIKIYANDSLEYNENHMLVFGGKNIFDSVDLIPDFAFDTISGTTYTDFITEFERPKVFKGQPFELRFCYDDHFISSSVGLTLKSYDNNDNLIESKYLTVSAYPKDGWAIIKTNPIEETGIGVSDSISYFTMILEGQGQNYTNLIRLDYVKDQIPGGALLRWVNRYGGVDQWYFYLKDTKRPVSTDIVPVNESPVFIEERAYNQGTATVSEKRTGETFVMGSNMILNADFKAISSIAKSRRIDMYVGSGNWMQVVLADYDFTTLEDRDYQDVELQISVL